MTQEKTNTCCVKENDKTWRENEKSAPLKDTEGMHTKIQVGGPEFKLGKLTSP